MSKRLCSVIPIVLALVAVLTTAGPAAARARFRPRIGSLMGIVPPLNKDVAAGPPIPVVYHGGQVMRGVTIHTIFWAPKGFHFDGPPAPGVLGYEPMIQQFFTDAAHDAGAKTNEFSVLGEYPDPAPGLYQFSYHTAGDSINDTDPYPPKSKQCPSPAGIPTCVTDRELGHEIDKVIQAHDRGARGLHNIWFIMLPPDVDTCDAIGDCGTTAFAGYHSLFNLGHGFTIYGAIPDPLIEFTPPPGDDPEGNPEAESTIDTLAHETVEAITNPVGEGWMDPNGFEVADKCEFPEYGSPLGFAPDGSMFNEVMNGHRYLNQEMWSNARQGCVQRTASVRSALPLARVTLRQFSPSVSGNIGPHRGGVSVRVGLLRGAGVLIGEAQATTHADGNWGPVSLRGPNGGPVAPGDDRDLVLVEYGRGGPGPDEIATGDGGNPFTLSGWTGWFDLDNGYRLGANSAQISPCEQTGVLTVSVGGRHTAPPDDWCNGELDVARVSTPHIAPNTRVTISSVDNRAVTAENPNGALVKLIVPAGEPGSVSALGNGQIELSPGGFPSCTADLRAQAVRCTGLRPGARYRMSGHNARANDSGAVRFSHRLRGGVALALRGSGGRVLTALHVAKLRVDIAGQQTVLAGGHCQPGAYFGRPLSRPPVSGGIGLGVAGNGTLCPASGNAAGLPSAHIEQSDDLSGGETQTEVPEIEHATPADGDTVYGPFIAFARSDLPGPHGSTVATGDRISLTVTPVGSKRVAFRAPDVDSPRGTPVRRLHRGAYVATWVVKDVNGDTRTVKTDFTESR